MKKIVLKISGMHCTSCAMNIDCELEDNISGVKNSNTNYAKQQCEVEIEDSVLVKDLINQIKETGYEAELV